MSVGKVKGRVMRLVKEIVNTPELSNASVKRYGNKDIVDIYMSTAFVYVLMYL